MGVNRFFIVLILDGLIFFNLLVEMYILFFSFVFSIANGWNNNIYIPMTEDLFKKEIHFANLQDKDLVSLYQDTNKYQTSSTNNSKLSAAQFFPKHIKSTNFDHASVLNQYVEASRRKEWVEAATRQLLEEINHSNYPEIKLEKYVSEEHQYFKKYVKINENSPVKLQFSDGSYLIFRKHSVYEDYTVGDITIAMNDRGILYKNEGHICGGTISFVEYNKMEISSSYDFIRHFKSDTDSKGWVILRR